MNASHYFGQKIVYLDTDCLLCNSALNFLIRHDGKKRLKFASLQSDNAISLIEQYPIHEDTVIFYDEGRIFTKSTAVIKIAGYIDSPYSAFAILRAIPLQWRDRIYDRIARNRSRWFGTKEKCRVPDQETLSRIIG
jgi:predicted DCC family thiol-disulfide oxidoreductase YuxK